MKFIVEGKEVEGQYTNVNRPCSSLHKEARKIIGECFPYDLFHEEVYIPKAKVYIDFIIPRHMIAIEVQGEQHFKLRPHFMSNIEFLKARGRDNKKHSILENSGYTVIELNYNEKKEWKKQLMQFSTLKT